LKLPSIRSAKQKPRTPGGAIAVAIDSQGCNAALVDQDGRIHSTKTLAFSRTALRGIGGEIASLITETGSAAATHGLEVTAIGLSVAGFVNPDGDGVTIARRPGSPASGLIWINVALKEAVESELSSRSNKAKSAKIAITNRAAAAAIAEAWIGAASDARNVVYLSVGDVIETGLLVDGRVLSGASGRAGAAGWFALSETFREEFADFGCLNVESAQQAVVRRTIESWHNAGSSLMSRLSVSDPSEITADMVIRAARAGDTLATKVIGDLSSWIGRAIADLISLLNPEVVVVGGSFGLALRPFLGDLRREARRWAEPGAARQCRIVTSSLGEKAALVGAARLALLDKK
jgi:glucokinase